MKVEIVAIGTELLLGQIVDTNSSWIGAELAAAGLNSHFQTKVGDNPSRMKESLELALSRSDAVICCGGLGPTQDDLTRPVVAEVMGVELELREELAERIRLMFTSRGREMPENNLVQAMVPRGASPIAQQPGTAPGLVCPVDYNGVERVIYAVPGVPYEMKEMVTGTVIPDLRARSGDTSVIASRVVRTWGQSESGLAEILADRIDQLDAAGNPTLAFLASGVEGLKVRITAKAADQAAVSALLDSEQAALEPLIGRWTFAYDDDNMETVVVRALAQRGLTLAVAESLTGGYLSGRICQVPGVSETYRGGIVAYNPEIKHRLLEVPDGPIITEQAAAAMAEGVCRLLGADVGIGTTGVAGPDDAEGRPVGTVCMAVSMPVGEGDQAERFTKTATIRLPGDRERIRQFSTITVLDMLRKML
ncbi:MAG: competence/damage-inducible protein A [Acidimicrobiia bacterium]|nr:competence/damage-inducible protein A [Acidimicrobiia bacterium]